MRKDALVECDDHGLQPGYIVCVHILSQGRAVHVLNEASVKEVGEMLCKACSEKGDALQVDELKLICAKHAEPLRRRAQ